MCGIFASFDRVKLEQLFNLNYKRGQKGLSLNGFTIYKGGMVIWESRHESDKLEIQPQFLSTYNICHVIAPTTTESLYHPALREGSDTESEGFTALWHNGILKEGTISMLQLADDTTDWDTQLMVNRLHNMPFEEMGDFLSALDGSFACLLYRDSQLFVFRNELVPLYCDNMLSLSSVKFKFSMSITPNVVWRMNFETNKLEDTGVRFTTMNNPYAL